MHHVQPTSSHESSRADRPDLDAHRPRSLGPLDGESIALARAEGLSLAYDPVQIGWVPTDCLDDFGLEPESLADGLSPGEARLLALRERFEERATRLLRDVDRRRLDAEEAERRLWSLPESLLRGALDGEAGAPDRSTALAALRALQARAHARIVDRLHAHGDRRKRRHEALIEGHALVLRPWREDEARVFRTLLDDPRVWQHLPDPRPEPLDDAAAADLIALANGSAHHEVRAIEVDGRPVGQIRMLFQGPGHDPALAGREGEISYWLGVEHWGHGIASAAIPLYTLLVLQRRALESVFARVAAANVASRRALEKAGYRDEGDLAAALAGDPDTRILRCHRGTYLDAEPREGAGKRAKSAATPGVLPEAPSTPGGAPGRTAGGRV